MNVKEKGVRHERELAEELWERGWAVVRGPASGSGARKRFQPDIVAARDGVIVAFEVKRVSDPSKPLYINKRQVTGLLEWARRAGGRAFIAVRIPGVGWRFHDAEGLEDTGGGSLKISKPSSGLKLIELEETLLPSSRKLDYYFTRGQT